MCTNSLPHGEFRMTLDALTVVDREIAVVRVFDQGGFSSIESALNYWKLFYPGRYIGRILSVEGKTILSIVGSCESL